MMSLKKHLVALIAVSQLVGCAHNPSHFENQKKTSTAQNEEEKESEENRKTVKNIVIGTTAVVGVAAVIVAGVMYFTMGALAKAVAGNASRGC